MSFPSTPRLILCTLAALSCVLASVEPAQAQSMSNAGGAVSICRDVGIRVQAEADINAQLRQGIEQRIDEIEARLAPFLR